MNEETRKKSQKNTSKPRFVVSVLVMVMFVCSITIDLPKVHLLFSAQFLDFRMMSVANADTPYLQSGYSYSQGTYGQYSQGTYGQYSQGSYGDYSQSSYGGTESSYAPTLNPDGTWRCTNGDEMVQTGDGTWESTDDGGDESTK